MGAGTETREGQDGQRLRCSRPLKPAAMRSAKRTVAAALAAVALAGGLAPQEAEAGWGEALAAVGLGVVGTLVVQDVAESAATKAQQRAEERRMAAEYRRMQAEERAAARAEQAGYGSGYGAQPAAVPRPAAGQTVQTSTPVFDVVAHDVTTTSTRRVPVGGTAMQPMQPAAAQQQAPSPNAAFARAFYDDQGQPILVVCRNMACEDMPAESIEQARKMARMMNMTSGYGSGAQVGGPPQAVEASF